MLPGQIENSCQPNIFHLVGTLKNLKNKKQKNSKEFATSFAEVSLEQVT